ncbi:MAG: hypothetical protein SFW67_01140 [Myxococcaceae bacterium]|nr:hypothetical protein [Myxococcaceae bacterium]
MKTRLALALSLSLVACGGGSDVLMPSEVTSPAIQGLVRERGTGQFVEFATETFEALYDAETVRAPEWQVTGGTLMGNGNSAKWQLPRAGEHTISLTVYLQDGREVKAAWKVVVVPRS